jgi:hypothetical protein
MYDNKTACIKAIVSTKVTNILKPLIIAATGVSVCAALLDPTPALAVNLVTNGDFENGFNGWQKSLNSGIFIGIGSNGSQVALFELVGSLGFISQTFSTVVGQNYSLSYDLASDGFQPNQFQVKIGGNTLFDRSNIGSQPFTSYNFNFVGTGSDTLQFGGRNDPGSLSLDNVVVAAATPTTSVPEPFTIVGTMIGGTAALRLRKKLKADKAQ